MTHQDLPLGRHVDYPREYDASLLFPIARALGRGHIGIDDDALPFIGLDRWHAYELSWLDAHGKPHVGTATITVPATAPNLIESKSLKLYLNSFNSSRFDSDQAVRERMAADLTRAAGAPVDVAFGLPPIDESADNAIVDCIDGLDVAIDDYGPPNAAHLAADPAHVVTETLTSSLLKSNCPVTGQPDWARVVITTSNASNAFFPIWSRMLHRSVCRWRRATRVAVAWTSIPGARRRAASSPPRGATSGNDGIRSSLRKRNETGLMQAPVN
jgi:7-cyano-7-deazaguanine reductase